LLEHHSSYALLLDRLTRGPLVLRTYTEEELKAHRDASSLWLDGIAAEVAAHSEATMGLPASAQAVQGLATGLREALVRRFREVEKARAKDVLDTVDDAVCALTLARAEVPLDAISFNTLMSWSRWLYLAEESRYVAGVPGRTIWAAAEVTSQDGVCVTWRGVRDRGDRVASLLPTVYRELAERFHAGGGSPLLPIYEVRATVAFRAGVAVPVVDNVIAQIVDGDRRATFEVTLALGTTAWPAVSEPAFALGERPYYVMSVTPKDPEGVVDANAEL
jgi:hypothetical protein